MRRQLPILIVFVSGVFMIIQYFIPHESFEFIYEYAMDWIIIIGIFAMLLGLWSLTRVSVSKVQTKAPGWGFSVMTLIGLATMLFLGIYKGNKSIAEGTLFMDIFWNIYTPIQATMFALLAFYIASAAYRAFRARTVMSTILLVTALVIMLRLIPLGPLSGINQTLASWILTVPNMAAKRAIWIGIGLGATATCLKIIFGIERAYMGKD
jgi:FlaA1/EpsC-like NDP-sugar epimerase